MKIQLESTSKIVTLVINGVDVPARIWEGHSEDGVSCHAYIVRLGVKVEDDQTAFERELLAQKAPTPAVQAIPLRMVL